ncbi:MAG: hypothetical protein ACREN8_11990, partial [Candidatus Dormibacteraceae bacterium]
MARTLRSAIDIELPSLLESADQKALATELFGMHDWSNYGVGEILVLAPELRRKFTSGSRCDVALARAIADWYRCGMQRPVPERVLQTAWHAYLPDEYRDPDIHHQFEQALRWLTSGVSGSDIALAYRQGQRGASYRPNEYLVDFLELQWSVDDPQSTIPTSMWQLVTHNVTSEDAYAVGVVALSRGERDTAVTAWRSAGKSDDALIACTAQLNMQILAIQSQEFDRSLSICEEIDRNFSGVHDPHVRRMVAAAIIYNSEAQLEIDAVDAAAASLRRAANLISHDTSRAASELRAVSQVNLAGIFGRLGEVEEAVDLYAEAIADFAQTPEPFLRVQAAIAVHNRGLLLHQQGRLEDALSVLLGAEAQFRNDPAEPVISIVVSCMRDAARLFVELGRIEAAIEQVDRLDALTAGLDPGSAVHVEVNREGSTENITSNESAPTAEPVTLMPLAINSSMPSTGDFVFLHCIQVIPANPIETTDLERLHPHEALAIAIVNRGLQWYEEGRFNDALNAYQSVIDRFNSSVLLNTRRQVAKAIVCKAMIHQQLGHLERTVKDADQVCREYKNSDDSEVANQVAKATVMKGVSLLTMGQIADALEVFNSLLTQLDENDPHRNEEAFAGA